MQAGRPSRTAMSAAMHRAAHQLLEEGSIFRDELALPILDDGARRVLVDWASSPQRGVMRIFIAARSRFAEARVADAVERGVRQVVIVGAGLDTFGLRNPDAGRGVQVFEVDHPSTQAFKRERIAEAGLEPPPTLRFAPVDFETETLDAGLAAAGFDAGQPACFVWLGVVPYLTEIAIFETFEYIAGVPGAAVILDYANPADQLGPRLRQYHERGAAAVAALGEPWLSAFDSDALAERLRAMGASEIEDLGPLELRRRFYGQPDAEGSNAGGHLLHVRWR